MAGYALLAFAWAMSNPPFAAPDESAHYLRALGVANGEVVGRPTSYRNRAERPEQEAIDRQLAREVSVPGGLLPNGYECFTPQTATASAACHNSLAHNPAKTVAVTVLGTYPPLPYLLPALTIRSAHEPGTANRIGRITELSVRVGLLAAAVWLLWSGSALSLLGLVLALTPMVIFTAASMGGSGLEIMSAICFAAAMLRLARSEQPAPAVWALTGAGGVTLTLSRSLGPAWVVLDLALLIALVGWRGLGTRMLTRPLASGLALASITVAALISLVWAAVYAPTVSIGFGPLRESLSAGGRQFGQVLKESVGVFGYLDLNLPTGAYAVWAAMTLALLASGLIVAGRRERMVVLAAVGTAIALPVLYYAAVARHGIGLQARHMLPMLVVLPLLAGELTRHHRARLSSRAATVLRCLPPAAAAVQLLAWYVNARRAAVGSAGPWAFLGHAQSQPPAGWELWLIQATLATVLLGAVALLDRDGAPAPSWRTNGLPAAFVCRRMKGAMALVVYLGLLGGGGVLLFAVTAVILDGRYPLSGLGVGTCALIGMAIGHFSGGSSRLHVLRQDLRAGLREPWELPLVVLACSGAVFAAFVVIAAAILVFTR
ncbi:MAG: hypothetical protein DLM61_26205 [Pseudonocardiales bacterium]|nr:MAG: hypothetical protein DLM61_26205 [Pseudonocardiales bacterium]